MNNNKQNFYQTLKRSAKNFGADLFGVADIKNIKQEFQFPPHLLENLDYAVSLGVRLSAKILAEIEDHPTRLYYHHYRVVNHFLDWLAFRITQFIQEKGYAALPIPASQTIDWEKQLGHLSHKKIAYLAGLGWLGRNNLLVNSKFGSQLRLVTVLTDMPLKTDKPLKKDCRSCQKCIVVCPVGAIKESQKDFNYLACFEKLKEFRKASYTDQFICGICVKICRGRFRGNSSYAG